MKKLLQMILKKIWAQDMLAQRWYQKICHKQELMQEWICSDLSERILEEILSLMERSEYSSKTQLKTATDSNVKKSSDPRLEKALVSKWYVKTVQTCF